MGRDATKERNWRFFRAGGFDQANIDRADDIAALSELDQKLWAALACPVSGLELDEETLALIDTDGDGRIRVPEVLAAIRWLDSVLSDLGTIRKGGDSLALAAIDTSTDEGSRIAESARQILANLEKPEAEAITLADVADTASVFAGKRFNGDGIVPPEAAGDDEDAAALITDAVATLGGVEDRLGVAGVGGDKLGAFFAEAQAYSDWWAGCEGDDTVLPLGPETAAAAAAVAAVAQKVEDYFTRCRLVAFDARAEVALNRADTDWQALAGDDLAGDDERIAAFPLARVGAGRALSLDAGVNPAWTGAVNALRRDAITPLLGEREELTEADWAALRASLAPFEAWSATKAGAAVEGIGLARLREYLAGGARAGVERLIEQDLELKPQADAIDSVEKLVRLQRDFYTLLENFVNLRQFYGPEHKAIFQTGVLYLDNRSCDLVVRVDDAAKHSAMAGLSRFYLAYLDCTRRKGGDKRAIAAAFTNGDADFLMVGRNGVFYDRDGADWDATITKVVDGPISIRQAFFSPYKKVLRLIESQIEKFAAAKEKEAEGRLAAGATAGTQGVTAPAAPTPGAAAFDIAKFAGIFAAIGLAVGAIGSALALLIGGFLGLPWWQMPIAVAAMLLLISGPSMLLAALKLRQRNLAPLLEANGWAVNARAHVSIPFGRTLTSLAELPEGAERSLDDPYAPRRSPWPWVFVALVALGAAGYVLWSEGLLRLWFGIGG